MWLLNKSVFHLYFKTQSAPEQIASTVTKIPAEIKKQLRKDFEHNFFVLRI